MGHFHARLSKVRDLAGKAGLAHETLIMTGAHPGVGAEEWLQGETA